jgi:phage recombination protein Bet
MAWDSEQIEIIKQQIAKGASDAQLAMFSQVCQKTGLDPFSRQIYCIMRGGSPTIQISIDGFRTIAARSNLYGGSTTEWCGDDGIWRDVWLSGKPPAAAKTTVWRRGCPNPFTGVARYGAYSQGNSMWSKMPDTMIAKVSEALALRKAFPAELSGLYSSEEMEQADNDPIPTKTSTSHPKAATAYSDEIKTRQQALRECMEILEWDADTKAAWIKTISPVPISKWDVTIWDLAVVKALAAIDQLNSDEPVLAEVV